MTLRAGSDEQLLRRIVGRKDDTPVAERETRLVDLAEAARFADETGVGYLGP